ncbi:hypothetical protein [Bacilliculturomica massiliensis]|nr:hypothetical protein [Bacilliculturomica massiliensis]
MKQILVMLATVILGLFLFDLVCGDQPGSVMSTVKTVWDCEIQARTREP